MCRALLVGICESEYDTLLVRSSQNLESGRQRSTSVAHRYRTSREPRSRRNDLAVIPTVVLGSRLKRCRRIGPRRIHDGLDVGRVHRCDNAVLVGLAARVLGIGQARRIPLPGRFER